MEVPMVRLRALEPEDLELLYTIENEEELWDVGSSCTPMSKYALRQYLASQPQNVLESGEVRLVIVNELTGKAVGLLDLTDISFLDGRAEVGIALLRSERGKRIGQAALVALERYARQKLRLRLLFAQIGLPLSENSKKIFESVGYEQIALLPEWHYRNGGYESIAIYQKKL